MTAWEVRFRQPGKVVVKSTLCLNLWPDEINPPGDSESLEADPESPTDSEPDPLDPGGETE